MQFVILAGTRTVAIGGRERMVGEVEVGGLGLVQRAARAAQAAGADRLLVLAPSRLCDAVRSDGRMRIPVDCRPADEPRPALLALREELDDGFWIVTADRVVSPGLFPGDASGDGPCVVTDAGGAPVGTVLATRDSLEELSGSDLHDLVARGRARAVPAEPRSPWLAIHSEADRRAARRMLFAALRKPLGHDSDGIVAYTINRPISLAMTRVLVHTPVTPNQVSAAALALGLLAAGLVATGRWPFMVAAGLLLQLASILDGVDGEIARLKLVTSQGGEWFDTVCDDVTSIAFFVGTGLACHARNAAWALPVTIAGAASWVILDALLYRDLLRAGHASHNRNPWVPPTGRLARTVVLAVAYLGKRDLYTMILVVLLLLDLAGVAFGMMLAGVVAALATLLVRKVAAQRSA